MTKPQHRREAEQRKRRKELAGLALLALGSLGAAAATIAALGVWGWLLLAFLAVATGGWFLASGTDDGSPGTWTGTLDHLDGVRDPVEVDTDDPDPDAFIPEAPGTFTPPPPSRDHTRDPIRD